jgi:hypothetical protein
VGKAPDVLSEVAWLGGSDEFKRMERLEVVFDATDSMIAYFKRNI